MGFIFPQPLFIGRVCTDSQSGLCDPAVFFSNRAFFWTRDEEFDPNHEIKMGSALQLQETCAGVCYTRVWATPMAPKALHRYHDHPIIKNITTGLTMTVPLSHIPSAPHPVPARVPNSACQARPQTLPERQNHKQNHDGHCILEGICIAILTGRLWLGNIPEVIVSNQPPRLQQHPPSLSLTLCPTSQFSSAFKTARENPARITERHS